MEQRETARLSICSASRVKPKIYLAPPIAAYKLKVAEGNKNVGILRPSVAFKMSKQVERQCLENEITLQKPTLGSLGF